MNTLETAHAWATVKPARSKRQQYYARQADIRLDQVKGLDKQIQQQTLELHSIIHKNPGSHAERKTREDLLNLNGKRFRLAQEMHNFLFHAGR